MYKKLEKEGIKKGDNEDKLSDFDIQKKIRYLKK